MLSSVLTRPRSNPTRPPRVFYHLVSRLVDPDSTAGRKTSQPGTLHRLGRILTQRNFRTFCNSSQRYCIHRVKAGAIAILRTGPRQPLATTRIGQHRSLTTCLSGYDRSSLVRRILLPLFHRLKFRHVATTKRGSGSLRCNGSI